MHQGPCSADKPPEQVISPPDLLGSEGIAWGNLVVGNHAGGNPAGRNPSLGHLPKESIPEVGAASRVVSRSSPKPDSPKADCPKPDCIEIDSPKSDGPSQIIGTANVLSLLDGELDEAANERAFREALNQWRTGSQKRDPSRSQPEPAAAQDTSGRHLQGI